MESLDPRVTRLNIKEHEGDLTRKVPLDQFGTYEVFVQVKEEKPYQHEGIVHAPNLEMAFIFAKEQFSRRMSCTGLFVVETRNIYVSRTTDGEDTVYNYVADDITGEGSELKYEFFHLMKRGKQHQHVGSVEAISPQKALGMAKPAFIKEKAILNVWVIKSQDILFSSEEDKVIWETLPEKKFREAINYKASEKIKSFKAKKGT